jgi:hypothetical protein
MSAQPPFAAQFPAIRVFFMVFSGVIALVGLVAAAKAQDLGISLFGYGLLLFGLGFGFALLKRGFDEGEAQRHG